jgi:hypothetical protein
MLGRCDPSWKQNSYRWQIPTSRRRILK